MLKHLPNALTTLRLLLAPLVAWAVWEAYALPAQAVASAPESFNGELSGAQIWSLLAAGLFVLAAFTDLFDGMAARALNADSKIGRILDPIADKALVGLPLIALSIVAWQIGQPLWPLIAAATGVIIVRDLLVTTLRLASPDGEGARVSQLAKWKTAVELIAVGLPILMIAAPSIMRLAKAGQGFSGGPVMMFLWIGLLLVAATLSVITALQYLMMKPDGVAETAAEPGPAPSPTAVPEAVEAEV
jgi:CDP-diacylglycerol--glycerol-3-phosphate 3-phosphatidyltransferase